jgi:hypothetical protein
MQNPGNFPLAQQNTGTIILLLISVWATAWKGYALWKSAKHDQKYWFVAVLVLNTVGLLEIVYLSFFQKKGRFIDKLKKYIKKKKK